MCRQLVRLETMMKIHTTQNLSSPALNRPTNIPLPREIRYTKYSDGMRSSEPEIYKGSVSFKGKKEIVNKAVEAGKKKFAERVADSKGLKKIFNSGSFGKLLETTSKQEVLINSGTALVICTTARPLTIMALPGDKNKKDCAFAAAHSVSSGVWGFIVPLLFIRPLATGYNLALKEAGKYIKDESKLVRMWPHLDTASIKDANGKRLPMDKWLDKAGNRFIPDIKDVHKVPLPKHISEISEKTLLERIPDLDTSKIKTLSPNEWVTKNGEKVKFDLKDIFIAVKDSESKKVQYFPLKHVTEDVLKEVYPELDVASIKAANGERLHPDKWLKKDGKAFNFDNNNIFISDWAETDKGIILVTGLKRKHIDGSIKDVCYQKNNKDEFSLGTPIDEEMVKADSVNTVLNKLGGWLPDLVVTYPRATATIAIIPFILKSVFGIEKSKKPKEDIPAQDAGKSGKVVA